MCAGKVPQAVVSYLCGATLLDSKKRDGGLRPIAVGEVLRRLSSKCISKAVRSEAFKVLTPLQVGVGVQAGWESIIIHAVSLVQEDSNISPELKWILLLDFSKAFNNITRESMFQEVRARIPSMSAWLEMCYGAQPLLQFGDYTILSCSGVQQGDPLGPLGFALALHPLVEKINEQVPGLVINAWYLDDGTLCDSARDLQAALTIIEGEGPALGLHLNRAKSLLYIPEGASPATNPLPPDIPTTSEGFVLLGSPIVSPSFLESVILRRVNKVETHLTYLIHRWRPPCSGLVSRSLKWLLPFAPALLSISPMPPKLLTPQYGLLSVTSQDTHCLGEGYSP